MNEACREKMKEGKQPKINESMASFDQLRKLVKKEGIEAKNLVSWHVPLNESLSVDVSVDETVGAENAGNFQDADEQTAGAQTPSSVSSMRVKSGAKRSDFRSRHWSYLFDNLRRTVDAIYDTCYFDQSVIECKEAIMVLENCTKDFYALIDYLKNQAVWEKAEKPTAVAWEVRKTAGSPSKHLPPQVIKEKETKDGASPNGASGSLLVTGQRGEERTKTGEPNDVSTAPCDSVDGKDPPLSAVTRKMVQVARIRRRPRPSKPASTGCQFAPVVLPALRTKGPEVSKAEDTEDSKQPLEEPVVEQNLKAEPESVQLQQNSVQASGPVQLQQNGVQKSGPALQENTECGEKKMNHEEDGWETVSYTRHRRNSVDRTIDQIEYRPAQSSEALSYAEEKTAPKPVLSIPPRPPRGSVFPRSAEEIRQTKASLGKMAYNRQYLADQRQKELEDKLRFDRHLVPARRRAFAASGSSISLPSLNNRIGINFSNPDAVKRAAQSMKATFMKGGGRTRRFRSYQSMESVQSLGSIKEEEGTVEKDAVLKQGDKDETTEKGSMTTAGEEREESIAADFNGMHRGYSQYQQKAVTEDGNEMDVSGRKSKNECTESDEGVTVSEGQSQTGTGEEISDVAVTVLESYADEALKHLTEEEESLAQEEESIQKEMEEERKSIDIEMKRQFDDMDEDEDVENFDQERQLINEDKSNPTIDSRPMTWQELVARWEAGPFSRPSMCWAELADMELVDVRSPGQAAQVHEKLSSPSRQRDLTEAIKKREERRTKAYELRQQILEQRHQRMRELSKRVEEVQEARRVLVDRKKALMEERLAKAEENRNLVLMARVKKAHDEDEKVNEIAFINSLEAGNKRLDVITRHQDVESRLQTIQEERQRRVEEKAAREAAVEERRKVAEERRQSKLLERAERTKKRQLLIEQQRSEQERERQHLAREKAREREGRLAEMKAVKQANTEELLQRIQQKQEESTRRHEENLEQIKQRASEMSTPRTPNSHGFDTSGVGCESSRPPSCQPYAKKKLCTVCSVLIPSELHLFAHLKGKAHAALLKDALPGKVVTKDVLEQESQKCIVDASEEKVQALSPSTVASSNRARANRKRRQRLRQKLQTKMKAYAAGVKKSENQSWQTSQYMQKITKASKDIGRCLENCGLDKQWLAADVHTLERAVGELVRILSQQGTEKEQEAFHGCKIQDQALLLLSVLEKQNSLEEIRLPMRSILNVCNMLRISIVGNTVTATDMIYSNRICQCVDALSFQIQCLNQDRNTNKLSSGIGQSSIPPESVVSSLMILVSTELDEVINVLGKAKFDDCFGREDGFRSRVLLVLSYMVASGLVDQFGAYCTNIVELELEGCQYEMVLCGFRLVTAMMKAMILSHDDIRSSNDDTTQLLEAIRYTDLCNVLPILYSVLLSPNTLSTGDRQTPPKLPESTLNLVSSALELVNCVGAANWRIIQDIFGHEGSSLEFRHVASFLISYGNRYECQQVLHPVIVSVGYFTMMNAENQDLVHFGNQPSILQQLCVLPFSYFSDDRLKRILYPTLIACTYRNEANRYLLEQELSTTLLSDFLKREISTKAVLVAADNVGKLERRFPRKEWDHAIEYFESPVVAVEDTAKD